MTISATARDTTSRNAIALAAVCLSSMMFGLEISSVPAILPTLEKVLHADFQQLQWIMNAYTIAVTTVLMATGTLADRYGRKRIYVASILVFGFASLLCGLAEDALLLILSRTLQGLSGGAMLICQVAVLSHQFRDGPQRARAFSLWGIIFGIGLGFGPIIGAAIAATLGWPWVFLVHAVLSVVTAALAAAGVRESRDPEAQSLDLAGIVTLSLAVFCLAYYITQGPELGFGSPAGLAILGVAILSFAAFLLAEKFSRRPMFDFSVLRIRAFSGALLGSMGMNFSFWSFMIYLPIYFSSALGYDDIQAGLALLAYTLPTLVVPPFGEKLLLRRGARVAIPAGLFTIGLGFFTMWIGSNLVTHPSWLTLLPGCLLAGIGLGLTNTTVTNTTTAAVSSARAGTASGIDMSARMISLALNIAIMGFILIEGIAAALRAALPATVDPARLQVMAQKIAGGSVDTMSFAELGLLAAPGAAVHGALIQGFGFVMLYGGIAVSLLALASFLVFGPARASRRMAGEGVHPADRASATMADDF